MTAQTDLGYAQVKQPLGVGRLLGASLSILFRRFPTVFVICLIPIALSLGASSLLFGWKTAFGLEDPDPNLFMEADATFWISFVGNSLIQSAVYGLTTALLVQLAYDAKLNRSRGIGTYFGPALRSMVPVVVLMIVVMVLTGIGSIALLLPGLWVFAVFYVTTPAIVIEGAGFRGMGRSARLTKNYRWQIIGLLILMFLVMMVLPLLIGFGAAFTIVPASNGLSVSAITVVTTLLITTLLQTLMFGLGAIVNALTFARLKEIKEGVGVDQLAEVFA